MNCSRLLRWAAVLGLAFAPAATTASAEGAGIVTITGTFWPGELHGTVGADLAAVCDNAGANTWTLTLSGTSYSHERFDYQYGTKLYTRVHATSFDFRFEGDNADALNAIVSQNLVGGGAGNGAFLLLGNADTGGKWGEWFVSLWPQDPQAGVSFGASSDVDGFTQVFASDPDGYPVLGSEGLSLMAGETDIVDQRPGNSGYVVSWYDTVDIVGDVGGPLPATLRILDGSVVEGNRGTSKLRLTVRLSNISDQTVSVSYRTVNGTAVAKSDYNSASGTVSFQPGETVKTITISIKADRTKEPDETFTVELYNAVNATIDDGIATATIVNDD